MFSISAHLLALSVSILTPPLLNVGFCRLSVITDYLYWHARAWSGRIAIA